MHHLALLGSLQCPLTGSHKVPLERHAAPGPRRRLDGVIDHATQEPGAERPVGIELADSLIGAQERRLHDVLGELPAPGHQVRGPNGLDLVTANERFQAADVTVLQLVDGLPFVHRCMPAHYFYP